MRSWVYQLLFCYCDQLLRPKAACKRKNSFSLQFQKGSPQWWKRNCNRALERVAERPHFRPQTPESELETERGYELSKHTPVMYFLQKGSTPTQTAASTEDQVFKFLSLGDTVLIQATYTVLVSFMRCPEESMSMEKAFILAHISRVCFFIARKSNQQVHYIVLITKKKRQYMLVLVMISLLYTVQYPGPGKMLHMVKTGLRTIVKPRYPLKGMLGGYITPEGRHIAVF